MTRRDCGFGNMLDCFRACVIIDSLDEIEFVLEFIELQKTELEYNRTSHSLINGLQDTQDPKGRQPIPIDCLLAFQGSSNPTSRQLL